MRSSLAERLHVAERIADNPRARDADRIAALALLARYGLPQGIEVSGPDGNPLAVESVLAAAKERLIAAVRREGPQQLAAHLASLAASADP